MHYLDARGPEGLRIYAIGDVHGRCDLLEAMHGLIGEEIARDSVGDWRIVHLGDYVDRGPDSRGVLAFLAERAGDARIVSLLGNHDAGMLAFLATADHDGLFARHGGVETARSYGAELDFSSAVAALRGARELARAVPASHVVFLRDLQRSVAFGDFFFCHAGIRPGVPLDEQDPEDLIWIRGPFHNWPLPHPKVIVHGHTPHHRPEVLPNRVNVDTLAFETGRLTALVIDGKDKRFIEASDR